MNRTLKIWNLIGEIDPEDKLFCHRQGIKCQVHITTHDLTMRGYRYEVPVFKRVELETISDVQETMLRLRFGDRVYVSQIGLPSTWD